MPKHSNRLIHETSPYLRQHAHNPVDWYPWGHEALAKARAENKPILLSVGYSACHWCHVMEHESFEDEATAELMNRHFVNIKVDREERPDIDHIYMGAVQMLTGHGGWPMTVFLTPEGKPFYGGTYFPPQDRHGLPSFTRVLRGIAQAYREKPDEVQKTVGRLMDALREADTLRPSAQPADSTLVLGGANALARAYDAENGGIGQAPKFPNEAVFELFLRAHRRTGERRYLDMVLHTLRRMGNGGIYDQLGGGFHRYSVDERWLVPHFEKMLYDNAQLVPLYLAAYQLDGDEFFARVARETLDYVLREMRSPQGGFYSSQDADSEGEEGRFFVWDAAEVDALLGDDLAPAARRYWDVTDAGNFEGRNILHVTVEAEALARLLGRDTETVLRQLDRARARLFEARERRVKPGRDDKVLTSWNALMISAFAKAAEILDDARYLEAAVAGVDFVEANLQRGDRLLGTWHGGVAKLNGYLDDYAFFVAALLDVHELTHERRYLGRAAAFTGSMLAHFWDETAAGFFFTSNDHESLIVRSKPAYDGSIPSGNSVALRDLLRLHHYTGELSYLERAESILRLYAGSAAHQPFGFANFLCAADYYTDRPREIVVVGAAERAETKALLSTLRRIYVPNRTLSVVDPAATTELPPLLQGKGQVGGKPTVYVCRAMTCSAPVTRAEDLPGLLVSTAGPAQGNRSGAGE